MSPQDFLVVRIKLDLADALVVNAQVPHLASLALIVPEHQRSVLAATPYQASLIVKRAAINWRSVASQNKEWFRRSLLVLFPFCLHQLHCPLMIFCSLVSQIQIFLFVEGWTIRTIRLGTRMATTILTLILTTTMSIMSIISRFVCILPFSYPYASQRE